MKTVFLLFLTFSFISCGKSSSSVAGKDSDSNSKKKSAEEVTLKFGI